MKTKPKPVQPYPLRRCYFCARNVQVKIDDPFLLKVLPNGRSFNFCTMHWEKLSEHASPSIVDAYRRKHLKEYEESPEKEQSLQKVTVHHAIEVIQRMRKQAEIDITRRRRS